MGEAAGAAVGGADAGDAQDPAILGQIGEFLEVCRLRAEHAWRNARPGSRRS